MMAKVLRRLISLAYFITAAKVRQAGESNPVDTSYYTLPY
jgi:hypothetical protein